MKYNGLNIICDADITMTGHLIGHSLSEVINNQQDQIDSLRSNVKWIYKYGGVGSGSGSGSGTSDSDSLKYLIEIDNTSYANNSEVNFGKQGIYHLSLKLFKIQGRTFDIKITYPTENGLLLILRKILPTSNPELTETLDLQVNGLLYVGISDDEGNVVVYNLNYIVTAYSFTLNYVYEDHSLYYPVDNNIYVNEIKLKGLLIDFHSVIASDFEPGTARYTYTDWSGLTYEYELTRGSHHIYLDPGIEITDENAGNYTFLIQPHITLEGETDPEVIPELKLQDNLIPTNCYLKIVSDGILYNSNTVINPSTYYLGAIAFKITPYQGPLDMTSTYYFDIQVDGLPYETMYTQLEDQTTYTLDIIVQDEGWHSVKFTIKRKNEVYETTLYFYAISPLGSFSWYPPVDNIKISPSISYKHKYNYKITDDNTSLIAGFEPTKLITRTTQLSLTTHVLEINEKDYQSHDLLLAFGIEYNPLNLDDLPILKLTSCDGNYFITIYLNKVIIKDLQADIYLPKEGFHLLTIYKRALRQKGNGKEYEWNIYIDGVLESALSSPDSGLECWLTLTVYNLILSINYIELSYFLHTNVGNNVQDYSAFIINPKLPRNYFNDLDILYHFYSYKLTYYPDSISDSFKAAYTLASSCFTDYSSNRVRTDILTITDIATNIDIPVLLLHYVEPKNSLILDFTSDGEAFLEWMEGSYDVKTKPDEINWGFNVDVYYSPGKKSLNKVLLNDDALFKLYLQGTSTMIYLSKNYDLVLETIEGSESTYLYTPNYSPNDSSTFLPEKRFTIKADVVDSSHSNNATIGKFVNSVCTLFAGAKLNSGTIYENYIKNTLLGFPVLLFIENSYYKNATIDIPTDDYYFLGISSFNLGRDSEFNLGYKDLRLLPNTLTEGMLIVSIPNLKSLPDGTTLYADSYLSDFGVAEILENKNYFDFSLYDDSILFLIPSNEKDTDYMFDKMKSNQINILKNALRILVESVAKGGGYVYDTLGKNMLEGTDEDPAYSYTVGYKHKIPLNLVGNYKKQLKRTTDGSKSIFSFKSDTEIKGEVENLYNTLIADSSDPSNIIIPTVDYKSLSEYYVICMALGLLDSVVKNLNVKTWNNKTFYTAFYDMDTSLGKDNAGNNSNYISFSDYWEPLEDEKSGFSVLQQARSYKDWFDPDVMGFDIPSTYLFALVKYGYHILNDSESDTFTESLKDWYPNNLWARMRLGKDSLPNWLAPTGTNYNHIGCLRNADYFVENYYGGYLKNVPDCFFNLNYRKKYLIFKDGLYEGEAFKKFSGKRIHYVKDWLNKRLHLLDLYFNLPNVNDPILQYDLETELWNVVPNLNYVSLDSSFIDQSNKDIVVLQNIFSTASSVKYSTDVKLIFTADDYSPICTSGETIGRYIAKNKNTQYRFEFASAGKSLSLGGSGNWLTVSDINSVIQGTLLYVHSDKLTTLKGTSNPYPEVPPLACNSWNIRMPALEEVILTHKEYSGELVFTATEDIAWKNLKSINISGSKLGLKLSSVPVQSVNASSVTSTNNLTITNCALLNLLNYHKSRFNTLLVTYPLKNSSIDTTNVSFAENIVYDSTSKTFVSGNNSNFVLCNTLQVTCSTNKGKIYIGGLQYTLNNQDNGLLEITLKGYTHIYINNCPFIKSITINDPETVLVLQVTDSANRAEYFSINSSIPNTVDLTLFINLESLTLNKTKKFTIAKLRDNLKLDSSAFNLTSLKYLDGNNIKLGNSSLFSLSGFTLRKSDTTTLCNFDFTGVTSLDYVFYGSAVNLETFKEFNEIYKENLKGITNTSSTWGYCTQIKYSVDDLLSDYLSGKCSIDLSMYSSVTNANGMFDWSGIKTVHPEMLNGFGASSFSANYMFNFGRTNSTEEIVLPIDWLRYVSNKITNFSNPSEHTTFRFVNYSNNQLVTQNLITPSLIFGSNPIKLKSIVNWNLSSEHTLNIGNDLTKFTALGEITKSFCKCNGNGLNYTDSTTGAYVGFLYELPKVVVKGSFGFLNWDNITVSYDTFIDWLKAPNIFLYIQGWDDPLHVFAFKKTIGSIDNFWTILVTLLLNHKYSQLCHVFENCVVLEVQDLDLLSIFNYLSSNVQNTSITNISYLFYNMRLVNSGTDRYWEWDWNIFKKLPNVTVLRYTFYKMFFNGGLPFNLFNRRYIEPKTVYITKGDASSKATLYSHKYTNKITDLYYTFYGCLFDTKSFVGFEKSYNKDDVNSPDFIEYIVDGVVSHPTTYYTSSASLATLQSVTNPDYDDFNLEAGYNETANTICGIHEGTPLTYYNYPIYSKGALLPPDIFYACSLAANLLYCFADSNLEGYIPDNLFKNNCKLPILLNFIKNVIILPKKMYGNYVYSADLSEAFDLYYYIGSEFVNSSDLNSSFNCHICLPYDNYTISGPTGTIPMRSLYVFCLNDSFTDGKNFQNMLPRLICPLTNSEEVMCAGNWQTNILLNPMYDRTFEYDLEYTESGYSYDQDSGEYRDPDGNLVNLRPTVRVLGALGFKSDKASATYDKLINYLWVQFGYKYMLSSETNLSTLNRSSSSNWILELGYEGNFGISPEILLPFMSRTYLNSILISPMLTNVITDSSGSKLVKVDRNIFSIPIKKGCVVNFTDSMASYYRNSKQSKDLSINFTD